MPAINYNTFAPGSIADQRIVRRYSLAKEAYHARVMKHPSVGSKVTERIGYDIVRRLGRVELRRYPKTVLATVTDASEDEAFGVLFDFITGGNEPGRRIAMTAPVISTEATFSFVMPSGESMDSLPRPRDSRVRIVEVPERVVAALRFRGRANGKDVATFREELLGSLEQGGLAAVGEVFLMRYNPPFVPGLIRRNEVGIQVSSEGGASRE